MEIYLNHTLERVQVEGTMTLTWIS